MNPYVNIHKNLDKYLKSIFLENMGHFQNCISLQIGQYGSKWESQLVWSPRRGSRQNHDIVIWKYRFQIFFEILVDIYVRIHFVSIC